MEHCPLDGLEVDDLAAHTESAHNLTPETIAEIRSKNMSDLAGKIAADLRTYGVAVADLKPDAPAKPTRGMRPGGYL